jgi:hypothetical protein
MPGNTFQPPPSLLRMTESSTRSEPVCELLTKKMALP